METQLEPPLDEIVFTDPNSVMEMGGIHTNTVLHYFARSPYYDATSNNAALMNQAMYNRNMYYIIQTRKAFEETLKTMPGLEFMVTHDPSENDTKLDNSGIWVIRKQIRHRRQQNTDAVTPISSYYVVGENIYMAPSFGNIISNRMLTAVTSLTKALSTASGLPNFAPATGHSYLPPSSKKTTPSTSFQKSQNSGGASPIPSGNTPRPDPPDAINAKPTLSLKAGAETEQQELRTLYESWSLSLKYAGEYMDENPIVGEPGAFKLARAREPKPTPSLATVQSTFQPFKGTTPAKKTPVAPIKTGLPPETLKKEGVQGSAKNLIIPGTGKEKKGRRKSKAAGAGG